MAGTVKVFLFGTLRYPDLLNLVAGEELLQTSAQLPGWRVSGVKGDLFPILVPDPDGAAEGVTITPSKDALARLVHYEDAFGYVPAEVTTLIDGVAETALIFGADHQPFTPEGDWSLDHWIAEAGLRTLIFASEVMSYIGRFSGEALQFRRPLIEGRAESRVRAASMPPPLLGWDQRGDEVNVTAQVSDHAGYFLAETINLTHPRFDGTQSDEITREVFVAADAAIVLPYDPQRDRILLVEQFRMGPWRRGATYPWMLEPVAGRIDPGESPEDCMRREAKEEAGITLRELIEIGAGYPTPGNSSEHFHIACGLCDLPDGAEGLHGAAEEHEDIRTHILSYDAAMDLLSRGEANNIPLVLALVWLSRERSRLRASG